MHRLTFNKNKIWQLVLLYALFQAKPRSNKTDPMRPHVKSISITIGMALPQAWEENWSISCEAAMMIMAMSSTAGIASLPAMTWSLADAALTMLMR